MGDCCQKKACDLQKMSKSQSKVLWIVLAINAAMFFVELAAGLVANSVSLVGDSLDMFGDSVAYGSSLYVINLGVQAKAKSALLKAGIMLATGLAVLGRVVYQAIYQPMPEFMTIGAIGLAALAANLICLTLLSKHRSDDINMSSVWLCSRNDVIANVSVLVGGGLVFATGTLWPDLVVGLALTVLFVYSSFKVLKEARLTLSGSSPVASGVLIGRRSS